MSKLVLSIILLLSSCKTVPVANQTHVVKNGIDILIEQDLSQLHDKTVGLVFDESSRDIKGNLLIDLLSQEPTITATKLNSFEPAEFARLDLVIFDLHDMGMRYDKVEASLARTIDACKAANIPLMVLDRPNPLGGIAVEGPLIDEVGLVGFDPMAYLPIPTRHGMTIGELALLYSDKVQYKKLKVIKMQNWKREMYFDQTMQTWPRNWSTILDVKNLELELILLGLEGTNLTVADNSTNSPQGFCAPWIDTQSLVQKLNASLIEGVDFSENIFHIKSNSCPGISLKIKNQSTIKPLSVFVNILTALRDQHPKEFELNWSKTRIFIGRRLFHDLYEQKADSATLERLLEQDADEFKIIRKSALVYPM